MSINTVALMGRLTADPELRTTNNGTSVISFAVAVDRKYTPSGQERQTDFIDCVAWRQTADFITRYFHKGDLIAIEGEIQTRNYEDKHGNKRKAVEVVVSNVSFCGGKSNSNEQGKPGVDVNEFTEADENDDGLPF